MQQACTQRVRAWRSHRRPSAFMSARVHSMQVTSESWHSLRTLAARRRRSAWWRQYFTGSETSYVPAAGMSF